MLFTAFSPAQKMLSNYLLKDEMVYDPDSCPLSAREIPASSALPEKALWETRNKHVGSGAIQSPLCAWH